MPYYRIIIWTKRRKLPFAGIRLIPEPNINAVYQQWTNSANRRFQSDFVDVEVQMLSKLCTAVKVFERKELVKKKY